MKIQVNIVTSNDAFVAELGTEVARILRDVAESIEGEGSASVRTKLDGKRLYDMNGNPVGLVQITGRV